MISVIVPIYNAEKYLRECLDSIVAQTYRDLEVILVNDGSTDASKQICEEYCAKYPNFVLINKENGGQMTAWILGVENSHGQYFGFVDADDYIDPAMFEKMMSVEEKTNADMVMCGRMNVYVDRMESSGFQFDDYYGEDRVKEIYDVTFPSLKGNISQARWDKLFKRDIYIDNMKKYCSSCVRTFEDRFIVVPYIFSCKSFAFINEPLYFWRAMQVSSSRKPRKELGEIVERLYQTHKQMLIDKGLFEEYADQWEWEKIDFIRSIYERNVCQNIPRKEKKEEIKKLLTKENRELILKHKKECIGKFGKFIYWSFKLKSVSFMLLGSKLLKKQDHNQNAFS